MTLAACPYLFQLDWLRQSCATAVCVRSCFITSLRLRCRKILNNGTLSNCVKLNKSVTETFASLTEAYGDATLSRTMIFKWHKAFKEFRENLEDDPRSGRPMSSTNDQNVEVTRAVMAKDRRVSVRMIAEEMGLDKNAK